MWLRASICLILLICSIFKYVSFAVGAAAEPWIQLKGISVTPLVPPLGPPGSFSYRLFAIWEHGHIVCNWNIVFKCASYCVFIEREPLLSENKTSLIESSALWKGFNYCINCQLSGQARVDRSKLLSRLLACFKENFKIFLNVRGWNWWKEMHRWPTSPSFRLWGFFVNPFSSQIYFPRKAVTVL